MSEWTIFPASSVNAVGAVAVGFVSACHGGNLQTSVLDIGSKGCSQAEKGLLSSPVGLWDSRGS